MIEQMLMLVIEPQGFEGFRKDPRVLRATQGILCLDVYFKDPRVFRATPRFRGLPQGSEGYLRDLRATSGI